MKKIIILLNLLFLSSSCVSKLKVTVKSADREVVLKEAEKYIKEDVESGIATLENFYSNWNEDDILKSMFDFIEKEDNSTLLTSTREIYKNKFKSIFDNKLLNIKTYSENAENSYKKGYNYEALSQINLAGKIILEIQNTLKKYEINPSPSSGKNIINLKSEVTEKASNAISTSIRTKFPILGDPMVSFLTKDENMHIWKSCYNKTVSSNFFGNADIAFILRGNPPESEVKSGDYNNNFTIKGVRLDTNAASNALLTGLTQTLNFVANTQGFPLNIGHQQDSENPVPIQNLAVTDLANDKVKLESKKKKIKEIKRELIDYINSEKIYSKSGSDLTAAILRIENYWDILQNELKK